MLVSVALLSSCGERPSRTEVAGPFLYRWGDSPGTADSPAWAAARVDASGWSEASTLADIPKRGGDSLWIRARIPDDAPPGSTLYVPQVYLTFAAFVDGRRVGGFDHHDAGGKAWHVVDLPSDAAGAWLTLHIRSTYAKTGLRGQLHVGSRAAHLQTLFVQDTPRLILVVLFFFVGLASLSVAMRGTVPLAFGGFGAWALSLSVWTLFYTRVRDLYVDDPSLWVFLWGASLAVMGAAGMVFVLGLFGRGERILRWAVIVNIASSSIGLVMLIARPPASITNPFLGFHRAVLGLSYFVVVYVLIRRIRHDRSREAVIYLSGLSLHLLFGIHDILVSLGVARERDPLAHWGMLALTIAGSWALLERLSAMRRQVREYAAAVEVHAREREMMLRDLHDGLGRITTGIAMLSEVAQRGGDASKPLLQISELASAGTSEIRTFMGGLDDEGCDWEGLQARMRHQAAGMVEQLAGSFELSATVAAGAEAPTPYLYIQLLRVFQEGITNALKHAVEPHVRAGLRVTDGEVVLSVENDGVARGEAAPAAGVNAGAGLANMKARAAELGGSLELERDRDTARLLLRVPVPLRYARGRA
jgi:two-component system sensor histidine kinase DesK